MQRGLAGDAPAEFDAHAFDLAGVADLEAHAKVGGALVDQEDREDLVVNDRSDEVGDAVHQGVEVEGAVEGVGEVVEELDLEGLDANLGVGRVGVEELLAWGAIVTLVGVLGRGCFGSGRWRRTRFDGRRHSALR